MRVLLTGSSGWLGQFLAPRLRAAGHVAIGLDVVPGGDTQVVGSVADRATVEHTLSNHGIEAVVHAGALHKPDIARYPASAFIDANVTGTLNLLEAAVSAGHDRFVFTSTTSLMISQEIRQETASAALWLDETLGPLAPRNIYGVTKLAAEGLCRLHFLEYGLNCVVLRTGRFFPEEDDTHRELSGPNLKANEFLNRSRMPLMRMSWLSTVLPLLVLKFSFCPPQRPLSVPRLRNSSAQPPKSSSATFPTRPHFTHGVGGGCRRVSGGSMMQAVSSACWVFDAQRTLAACWMLFAQTASSLSPTGLLGDRREKLSQCHRPGKQRYAAGFVAHDSVLARSARGQNWVWPPTAK